ncbi:MAG: FAD:protein FMN transferase [Deltaproteobacteria bacterium]|nr:FAD:protein FMN transferase [Deltaproteobacteria bacterium]
MSKAINKFLVSVIFASLTWYGFGLLRTEINGRVWGSQAWAKDSSGAESDFQGVQLVFESLNTGCVISVPTESGASESPQVLAELAKGLVLNVNTLLSPYGPQSDVRKLNEAGPGIWVDVEPLTIEAVNQALVWNEATEGVFEPTIGPLKALYKFDGQKLDHWPSEEAIATAKNLVGPGKILVDAKGSRLAHVDGGIKLDLGGLAKGFAADLVAEAFANKGVVNAMINLGGEMRVMGKEPHDGTLNPWVVGLYDPLGRELHYSAQVWDKAIATSGYLGKWFEYQGQRYSHIIDPLSGSPISDEVAGVTVVHPGSATAADALATAFSVMGPSDCKSFLEKRSDLFPQGLEVIFSVKTSPDELETIFYSLDQKGTLTVSHP